MRGGICIHLGRLALPVLTPAREKRQEGFYYYQISDMMNKSHFKPQRTLKFTPQKVWGLEFKM